jgi:hypothetical protein
MDKLLYLDLSNTLFMVLPKGSKLLKLFKLNIKGNSNEKFYEFILLNLRPMSNEKFCTKIVSSVFRLRSKKHEYFFAV